MRIELFLSLRLLRDSRTQSALIALGVAVGVGIVVFLSALIGGLQRDLIGKTVGAQPDIAIRPADERPRSLRDGDAEVAVIKTVERVAQRVRSIDGWQRIIEQVRATPGVAAASPICRGPATALRGNASRNVVLTGIEPDSYRSIVDLSAKLTAGTLDLSGRGVVVGYRLAEDLGASIGDKVRLEAGGAGRTSGEVFEIRGLVELGNLTADESWAVVSLRSAQSLLDLSGGATELELAVDSIFAAEAVAERLRAVTGLETESWMETNAQLLSGLRSQSASSWLIQVFVLLAVTIGIASVLVVSVVQRRREIGILRAIGLTRRRVQRVFVIQSLLLSVAGSVTGSALGAALLVVFRSFVKNTEGAPLFPVEVEPGLFLFAGGVAIAVGLIASVIPSRSAARLDPADAIRND